MPKRTNRALTLSLVANVVLLCFLAAALLRERETPPAVVESPPQLRAAADSASETASPPENAAGFAATEPTPAAIDQLERMGLDRGVIVNALLGDFHRRWDERAMELERRYAPRQVPQREYIELARAREAEQVEALKAALGEERYLAWDKERTLSMLNFGTVALSEAEAEEAYRLQKEFDAMHKELQMAMEDGLTDMADAALLQEQAQENLDRSLQDLLGADRFAQMRGVADPIADVYRAYGDLSPTPSQAEAVLQAEGEFRAREAALTQALSEGSTDAARLADELKALTDEREEDLREIFGADAYEAVARQRDPTYQKLAQFSATWQLDEREVESVYETLRAFHDEAERARVAAGLSHQAGQSIDWRELDADIERSRGRTEAGLQALIGPERLAWLKRNGMLTLR